MVHVPAKFRESTAIRFRVSVKTKRDGRTPFQYLPSRGYSAVQNMKKKNSFFWVHGHRGHQNVSKCMPHHSRDIYTIENQCVKNLQFLAI